MMDVERICPKCKTANRPGARFCVNCGTQLTPEHDIAEADRSRAKPSPARQPKPQAGPPQPGIGAQVKQRAMDLVRKLDDQLESWLGEGKSKAVRPGGKSNEQQNAIQPAPTTSMLTEASTLALPRLSAHAPGELIGSYLVLNAWSLTRSNYYQTRHNECPNGHPAPQEVTTVSGVRCAVCQAQLPVFLIHEVFAQPSPEEAFSHQKVIDLNKTHSEAAPKSGIPGTLKPFDVFYLAHGEQLGGQQRDQDRQYLVAEYPAESWTSLYRIKLPPADPSQVVNWCLNLGQALTRLGELNLAPNFASLTELLEALLIVQNQAVYADLTYFVALPEGGEAENQNNQLMQRQVMHLGQVLYTMASGKYQNVNRAPLDLGDVPLPFRRLVDRARRGEFTSLDEFLGMLKVAQQAQESARGLRQATGYRSSTGRVRTHNEDFIGKYSLGLQQTTDIPEVGLYVVADGMGGHQAGEQASSQAVRQVLEQVQVKIQELQSVPRLQRQTIKLDETITPGEVLAGAIQQANEVLYKARQQIGSDRGTTITAALVIGDLSAIANVGDSRTYLYHNGKLEQVTHDHSLVASLVAAKLIRPEEVRSHPQRNSILRSMGAQPTVEVDLFQRQLVAGDRLLLCSDGLWEMVLDSDIEQILRQAASPQAACDRLIDAANLAGGEDNVSAIVVWIE